MDWYGGQGGGTGACKRITQPERRQQPTFSSLELTTHGTHCRKAEAWQISGTWMTVTSCAIQPWCCLFCWSVTSPNVRVGVERNSQKTQVINHVNDLDSAPPEWKVPDVQNLAKDIDVTDGSIALGVAVGSCVRG